MFIGRSEEIQKLVNYLDNDKQKNIVIYGRHKIGKSELIKESLKRVKKPFIFFRATESTISENLNSLSKIIEKHYNLSHFTFKSFEQILDFIFKQKDEVILVINEYQYLSQLQKDLNSAIQRLIDKYQNNSKLKLVLIGSSIDIMSNLNKLNNPLNGRISLIMFIKEMNYLESSLFYEKVSLEDKVKYYSVFGGNPYYNSLINQDKTFKDNIVELIINKNSPLLDHIELTLLKELRKINNANAVFLAIANGNIKFNDILETFNNTVSSSSLSVILRDLIKMDLIKKTTPINEPINSRKTYYELKDNLIDFFYKYIYQNQSTREILNPCLFYDKIIKEDFQTNFVPKKFEQIAYEYLKEQNKLNQINPPLYNIGKYWYDNPKEKVSGEFNLVSKDNQGYIIYETKYTNKIIDVKLIDKLKEQLKKCNMDYYKVGFFTKNGFDIKESNDYYLKTLNDLYKQK